MQNIEPSRHCRRCCCGISLPSFERIVANFSQQRQNIIPIIDFCVQYVFGAAKARQPGGSITKGFLVPGVIPGRISSRKSSLRLDFFFVYFLPTPEVGPFCTATRQINTDYLCRYEVQNKLHPLKKERGVPCGERILFLQKRPSFPKTLNR